MAAAVEDLNSNGISALRWYGKKDLRLDIIDRLSVKPDEVRVKIAYCGICGSDLHEYNGGPVLAPKPGEFHPHTKSSLPVIMGHEMSGTVKEVGQNVTDIKVGDNVAICPALTDKNFGTDFCLSCEDGKPNLCSEIAYYGYSAPSGGFSDEVVVSKLNIFKLPENVSLKVGALVEPLSVAWHCVRTSRFKAGDDVVVLGAGPIGLAMIQVLRYQGAKNVIVSEVLEQRANQAKKFGADLVINPLEKGAAGSVNFVKEQVKKQFNGRGADITYDATGLQSTLDTAIATTKAGGIVFNIAIHEKPLLLNPNDLSLGEKIYTGGICYTDQDWDAVIAALGSGKLVPENMITSIVPLANAVAGGFEELMQKKADHIKILVKP